MSHVSDDRDRIDAIIARFFGVFDNRDGRTPSIEALAQLFVPGAIVVRDAGSGCEHCSVREFAEPRLRLLADGELVDFHEWETQSSTELAGRVAARATRYRKQGVRNGQPYAGSGRKFFQLVRLGDGWRISALAWSDEP